jgi:DNA invertase Pin-like site-specific DNA recombinase
VSTDDQNCELQINECREYCLRCGWGEPALYVDKGISGKRTSRPELDRLMKDARQRKIDIIVVWKLDRWGRSLSHCVSSLQDLAAHKVRWIAYTQNLDTAESNPMSRAMMGMMAVFAEFEREMIRERVLAGLRAAKSRGQRLGRASKVFNRGKALELRVAGKSIRQIAKELDVSAGVIQRLLEANPLLSHASKTPSQLSA